PRLGALSTAQLVAELASDNGWRRDTASRLLCERQDPQGVQPLTQLVTQSPAPLARLHALYALEAQQALRPELLIAALDDSEAGVRRHAIRLAERQAEGSTALQSKLLTLAGDPDPEVRYQLAFTLGELKNSARLEVLAELARRDAADRWMRAAIESSLSEGSAEVLARLLRDKPFRESESGRQFLGELAGQIAVRSQAGELQGLATGIGSLAPVDAGLARQLIRASAERLPGGVTALAELLASVDKQLLDDLIQSAVATASAAEQPVAARREAIESLWLAPWQTAGPLLSAALENRQPQEIQRAALATLRRFDTPEVAAIVLAAWPGFSPTARSAAAEVIFSRPQYQSALVAAIGRDEFSPSDLEQARVKLLLDESRTKLEPSVRAKLAQALAGRRQDVLAAYQPALAAAGDAARGKSVFQKTCAPCHRLEGAGHEIGPNLATIQNRGAEAILVNVLDPSREVNPQYLNYVLTTTDGRALTGMIATENANSITLQRAEKQSDTVLRQEIDELRSTGLSIMPEGLEKEISVEAMADLIAYLLSVK
ncbi:MAG: c-type cytochrome, partial [Planctomycetaceae bacterium]|nr:c-type cytochrome [Planctomycetaceae bacterium]